MASLMGVIIVRIRGESYGGGLPQVNVAESIRYAERGTASHTLHPVAKQRFAARVRKQRRTLGTSQGRRAINLHTMIEGALTASFSLYPSWVSAVGPRQLLALTDSDTAMALMRSASQDVEVMRVGNCVLM